MEKIIQIGSLVYEHEMTNPDTGWHKVKNQNATSFWVPDELIREINHIRIGVDNSWKAIENERENLMDADKDIQKKLKEKDNKIDSQRKSITYYKGERDSLQKLNKKLSNEFDSEKKAYKKKIETLTEMLDSAGDSNFRKSEEIDLLRHRTRIINTCGSIVIGTLIAILLLISL
jgi:DNA repair exonuclease SbcCD ATPase subunit